MLRRRRDELVMMPHAIRRVYVARRSRTAASSVVALLGVALLVTAATPSLTAFFAKGLPGINPAVLSTLIVAMWICGLFAYAAARAVDEHRFAVAMSRFVMPGKDLADDLERLSHEHPDQAARDMAHGLEVRSAALPVLAAGVLLPVTVLYIGAAIRAGGWPAIAEFEAQVALHANKLIACAGVGVLLAVVMTKRAARLPVVAPIMIGAASIGAGVAAVTSLWLIPVALVVAYVALVVRRLRIERDLLQAEDPAAGSEIFTIRGFIKQLRASASALRARIAKVPRRKLVVAGAIAGVAAAALMFRTSSPHKPDLAAAHARLGTPRAVPQIETAPSGSTSRVELLGGGQLRIDIELVDDQPLTIPKLVGLASIPHGWNMRVEIALLEGLELEATAFPGDVPEPVHNGQEVGMSKANCGIAEQPFGLQVKGAPGHYRLRVAPVLEPAGC